MKFNCHKNLAAQELKLLKPTVETKFALCKLYTQDYTGSAYESRHSDMLLLLG